MSEQLIDLKFIDDNPYQHREVYEDIEGLGRTIAVQGLQQAPKVRLINGRYQLKFGHRRKRAFEWLRENWQSDGLPERYSAYSALPVEIEELSDREMFDAMVVENSQRADLKPTEVAHLLKEYQEQFPEATSKEIGLVFNMNDATVRGMVRLLDLPKPVQEKLDDGTITQGTARMFLAVQKIAPEKKIVETLKRVEQRQGKTLPEEVIEDAIEHLDSTAELWNDGRDGKPRAGYHGWLLDMKNFPNHLLPMLNGKAATLTTEQVDHLTNPPACNACPFYVKIRGTHYCGVRECYLRKSEAWKAYILQQASKNLGIPIYTKEDGRYLLLENHIEKHLNLFTRRDPSLRLILKEMTNNHYHYQSNFKGVDHDVFYVVVTGETTDKLATGAGRAVGGKKTEKEKAEMRAMKIYRARRKDVMWEYTGAAQGMFEAVSEPVLKKLRNWQNILIDDRIPEDKEKSHESTGAEYQRRVLVWQLIMSLSSFYHRESLSKQLDAFQKLVGVKAPKALVRQVTEWDAEIEAVAKAVSTETKAKKK